MTQLPLEVYRIDMKYIRIMNHYMNKLVERGVPEEKIRKYRFAFCGKKVLIGKSAHTDDVRE